jgi:hypothetical protein
VVDALHDTELGLHIEAARGTDGDATKVVPFAFPLGHRSSDEIAGTKTAVVFLAEHITAREAISGEARALVRASTHALNFQGCLARAEQLIDLADARCVQRMSFG